ncbi:MAG TPA: carboxypeptidase-like regulatory domain-containing protein [Thermoanaerobaculia bacterium]|nr:carboxypeptidase-like regulatory domain-containing protein [Thermoanaerobaculia bacterium]
MKRPGLRTLALFAVALALAGGAVWFVRGRGPRPVRISGKTVASDGRPLSGVEVTLEVAPDDTEEEGAVERAGTVSDENGDFSIEYQSHWKAPSYRLAAAKAGYRELSVGSAETLKPPVMLRLAPVNP